MCLVSEAAKLYMVSEKAGSQRCQHISGTNAIDPDIRVRPFDCQTCRQMPDRRFSLHYTAPVVAAH